MATTSPIGTSVADLIEGKRARSRRYHDAHEHLRPFEQIARVVIMRRARLGLTQQDLAERMGTTASVIQDRKRPPPHQHRNLTPTG